MPTHPSAPGRTPGRPARSTPRAAETPAASPKRAGIPFNPTIRQHDPDGIPCRLLTLDEALALSAGDTVLHTRAHAGNHYLTEATVTGVSRSTPSRPSHTRTPGSPRPDISDETLRDSRVTIDLTDAYGSSWNVTVYTSQEVVDFLFPAGREGGYEADRQRHLHKQRDMGLFVEDPDGPERLPRVPVWGAQVYLNALIPDVDPAEALAVIEDLIRQRYPQVRLTKEQARPVEDFRVNVYEITDSIHNDVHRPLAINVLRAEAFGLGNHGCLVQDIPYGAAAPIVGT